MTLAIKPGAYLRRGRAGVSADTAMNLLGHRDELEAVFDALDARRDSVLEAMAESEAKIPD